MPFDGTEFEKPETVRQLEAAKALIADPAGWCQGKLHDGEKSCAYGAVERLGLGFYSKRLPFYRLLDKAALELNASSGTDDGLAPAPWLNDHTDHPTVMRMFDRAIELAWEAHRETADAV